ncbi:phosphoribosyltransferase [Streptomyces sp. HC44]|uniref:Phosphoribosyltransferase n=1 Tax=Streptomyces scabichelini TaxID=2711217 RepID=A0A6G4VFM1_9ACTN|nr:phosphoribosyltransferase family protein [Streptomyces scabichelini]NGO12620.1 phosphoribosyltransferase [Streptomyces scabichelini]
MRFRDRRQAGAALAERLLAQRDEGALPDPVVLALPRGGVVVAGEVARALDAPLDVLVARKIGAPFQSELGVGAIAGEDEPLFDERALDRLGLSKAALEPIVEREREELHRREQLYRKGLAIPELTGRTAVVVDDGVATGVTALAALRSVRRHDPARVTLAVPVCSPEAARLVREEADDVVCLHEPATFMAVGLWYEEFDQVTDDEVLDVLHGLS